MNSRTPWFVFAGILTLVLLLISVGSLALVARAYDQRYAEHIYPGISVYDVDVGSMTVDEATAALQAALPDPATLTLTLSDGERTWTRTWADLGIRLDPAATAQLAYQVGREGTDQEQRSAQLQALVGGHPIPPVIILPDPAQAAAALEALAPEVAVPPVNASLAISPESITPLPAQAGRELDIAATVAVLPHAVRIGPDGLTMDLLTRQVAPAIGNPGPAMAQARALLAQPLTLVAYDFLTNFNATWSVTPDVIAGWLSTETIEDKNGARIVLTVDSDGIRAYLNTLNSQLTTDTIAIDVERTASAVQAALEAEEHQATGTLFHPRRVYVVQPGDTLTSIARAHGFPAWRLVEVNPDIDTGDLHPGQEITIPSIDVLFPFPLITDRRIVIDISDLRLRAYEGETPVYDFPCSTGIDSSPTIPGTFQILSKEENAYASSWDLWMPHFMGVYQSGPDFTNGIHGLPTLSGGGVLWGGYLGRQRISYGCIVIGLDEAATLFEWAELGILVIIQD
jgi:lipoprotein-anchoring transpeptidase ErfK/SrfK